MRARIGVLIVALAVISAIAAYSAMTASADGRTLEGAFCTKGPIPPFSNGQCMSLTWDGVTYGTLNRADLTLRPGTYWLTVNDNSSAHDFTLRSCPDADTPCVDGAGTETPITDDPGKPGLVTITVLLKHGTYRLFCDNDGHEAGGMYVDFEVGGVGQVG
jgi:hypothetical protein